jgi:hypothetical protein
MSLSLISAPQTAACSTGERKSKRSNPYLGNEEWEINLLSSGKRAQKQNEVGLRLEKRRHVWQGGVGVVQQSQRIGGAIGARWAADLLLQCGVS